jgi:hypothetical protein
MPNALVKHIAQQSGVKKSKVEKTWQKLATEYGETNYKAIVSSLEKKYNYNSTAEDSNRQKTDFGHLKIENCVLTSESVDGYLGRELPSYLTKDGKSLEPDTIYYVYRPLAELKKALKSYNDVPLTNEHYFVDNNATNKPKWLGAVGSNATIVDGKVQNTVTIWDKDGVELVERIRKEGLSSGYKYEIKEKKGVWNGRNYDFEMSDIVCNHVALVSQPRNKPSKLADSININKDVKKMAKATAMDANALLVKLLTKNPELAAEMLLDSGEAAGENTPSKPEHEEGKTKDKKAKDKKGKDEEDMPAEDEENGCPAEDEDDDEKPETKDKKRGKDKKGKDEESESKEKEKSNAEDTAKLIRDSVNNIVMAHLKTKELCEKVIGKSTFGADSTPEQMINSTLAAKGYDHKDLGLEAKTAILQYMADTKAKEVIATKHTFRAADSSGKSDLELINLR